MVFYPSEYRDIPSSDLLSWLFDNTLVDSEKNIFIDAIDDTQRINTRQALSSIRKLVAGLKAVGLKPGDAVCVHAFNHILYSILYLGIVGAGGCFVGSNPSYTTLELNHLFSTTASKYIIIEADLLDKALPALLATNIPASQIFIFNAGDANTTPVGFRSWEILLQYDEHDWVRFNDEATAKSTIAALLSTSGTTGLPKAAAISHYAHVAAGVSMQYSKKKPYNVSRLISLPQFHAFAAPLVHISAFQLGHTTYIMRRFELDKFTRYVHRYGITETAVVPPMVASFVNGRTSLRELESLRLVWCAGSPLSKVLNERMYGLLHDDAVVSQVWGMTELGWVSTVAWPEKDTSGSVGSLLPNMEARVVDEKGYEAMNEGAYGEIHIRGPSIMNGYLNNSTATDDTIDDGWLKTGDMGYVKDGKFYIIDRIKELVKVRGWQVSPSELESTLLLHPFIVDAAVVGIQIPDKQFDGELPRAYVVVHPEAFSRVSERDIMAFVKSRMAKYKALDGGVIFVDSIPRNGSGKILRKALVERARAEVAFAAVATCTALTVGSTFDDGKKDLSVEFGLMKSSEARVM